MTDKPTSLPPSVELDIAAINANMALIHFGRTAENAGDMVAALGAVLEQFKHDQIALSLLDQLE